MNERLKKYLDKCGRAEVDEAVFEGLRSEMEEAVPEIEKTIRQRERLAAELRIAASRATESGSEKQD